MDHRELASVGDPLRRQEDDQLLEPGAEAAKGHFEFFGRTGDLRLALLRCT